MNRRNFLTALAGGAALGTCPQVLSAAEAAEPQTYVYKTAGGCEIQAEVRGVEPGVRKRGLIYIHGGALIGGSRKTLPKLVPDFLEKLGYLVIRIDYRLAPETRLPQIVSDVRDAIHWVRTQGPKLYGLNPDRLAIAGDSAGGFLTLMTGFCIKPRPTVLLVFWGYGDIAAPWLAQPNGFYLKQARVPKEEAYAAVHLSSCLTTPAEHNQRGRFYLYCRQNGLWPKEISGHDPIKESAWFDHYCPVRNVTQNYPPTFLLHGTADTDVPCEESKKMAEQMERAGVEHDLVLVPGGGHGLEATTPEEWKPIYARVSKLLNAHMA